MITTMFDRWIGAGTPSLDPARGRRDVPSAMTFVAAVVLASIAAAMGMALLVAAPRTVTIPIAVVLAAGLFATGLAVGIDRRLRGARVAVVAVSVSLLALALVAPDPVGAILTAAGLVGLLTSRLASPSGGWPPLRGASAGSVLARASERDSASRSATMADDAERRTTEDAAQRTAEDTTVVSSVVRSRH